MGASDPRPYPDIGFPGPASFSFFLCLVSLYLIWRCPSFSGRRWHICCGSWIHFIDIFRPWFSNMAKPFGSKDTEVFVRFSRWDALCCLWIPSRCCSVFTRTLPLSLMQPEWDFCLVLECLIYQMASGFHLYARLEVSWRDLLLGLQYFKVRPRLAYSKGGPTTCR